jgi:prevent-host-death family protein
MTDETISATAARRQLSRLLKRVRAGDSFVVTVRGAPVAKLVPVEAAHEEDREEVRRRLLERLRSQPAIDVGPWTRDELYEDDS